METMKAVRIHDFGGSEVLKYEDVERPEAGPDEVLVRVRAATVNPIDWKIRQGYLRGWLDLPMPLILGRDMAGDVVEVGSDVTDFKVGDKVFGSLNLSKGTHAEYVAAPTAEIAKMPETLDYETAASVPQAALAAWQALMEAGGLEEGQTVLVHGAAGNVGRYAVQFAKMKGARVIGTARQSNMQLVRDLGADEVIDYQSSRFEDVVKEADIVIDTVGDEDETQTRSVGVLKPGGVLVTLMGFSPSSTEKAGARTVRTEMVATRSDGALLQQIAGMIDEERIKPMVAVVVPLSQISQAHYICQSGRMCGRVVVKMED